MPMFFTHTINSSFRARDGGVEYDSAQHALDAGIHGAVMIAADEIQAKPSVAVEVRIEQGDGTVLLRSVVAISVSPMLPDDSFGEPGDADDEITVD